ncbi:MAG TPA: hypothetical protein VGM19_14585 [Armatimonadota bacterium]|jgi:hypothetical protein
MKIHVTFEAFPGILGADVTRLRSEVGQAMERIMQSGKMVDGGIFADLRGGYMIMEISSGGELQALLGGQILDNFKVCTHPIASFEELKALFARGG